MDGELHPGGGEVLDGGVQGEVIGDVGFITNDADTCACRSG
jgi:hypothetical protein